MDVFEELGSDISKKILEQLRMDLSPDKLRDLNSQIIKIIRSKVEKIIVREKEIANSEYLKKLEQEKERCFGIIRKLLELASGISITEFKRVAEPQPNNPEEDEIPDFPDIEDISNKIQMETTLATRIFKITILAIGAAKLSYHKKDPRFEETKANLIQLAKKHGVYPKKGFDTLS